MTEIEASTARSSATPNYGLSRNLDVRGRVGAFVEANWMALLGALILVGVSAAGLAGYEFFAKRGESKADAALYAAEGAFVKAKEGFERAKMKALMPAFAPPAQPGAVESAPPSGDLAKDYGPSIEALEAVIKEYPKSQAAQQAALQLASVYGEYKQRDKALAVLETVSMRASTSNLLGALTMLALGDARAAAGQCDKAVAGWAALLSDAKASYVHGESALKSGICFETMNQTDKAAEMYRKASTDYSETSAGQTAKSLLRALELKTSTGKAS